MERIGVHFLSGPAPTATVEYVKLAEELGYESAWVAEGSGGDPFSILTACALATKTIGLGTGVTPIFSRSAPTIGMAAACVDYFSGGRFILGMGSGHKVQVEQEHGLPFSQPVQRLREAIDVVRMLLRDNEIHYQGSTLSIDGFKLWFEPLRKEIPIYVGAVNPKMIEIGSEIAQGVTMTYCTLERARMAAEHVAIGARRAGKSPEEVVLQTHLPCAISSNSSKEDAINTIRGVFAPSLQRPRYRKIWSEAGFAEEVEAARQAWVEGDRLRAQQLLPAALIEKFAVVGSPEECRARVPGVPGCGHPTSHHISAPRGLRLGPVGPGLPEAGYGGHARLRAAVRGSDNPTHRRASTALILIPGLGRSAAIIPIWRPSILHPEGRSICPILQDGVVPSILYGTAQYMPHPSGRGGYQPSIL